MTDSTRTRRSAPGFLIALALGLAIAFGGLVLIDGGSAQAASYDSPALTAAPVTDTEACSTTGFYYPTFYGDITYVTGVTPNVYAGYPYAGYPYGYAGDPYGGYGYMGYPYAGYPYGYTVQTATVTVPQLPYYGEAYTSPTHVNYACNASSNCVPIANSNNAICPGVATGITLNSSLTSATCGSATNIDAKLVGSNGLIVGDGTPVLFSTTLGMIPGESSTDDGIASASLVFPPKTTGTAVVTVSSGNVKATATITVTC